MLDVTDAVLAVINLIHSGWHIQHVQLGWNLDKLPRQRKYKHSEKSAPVPTHASYNPYILVSSREYFERVDMDRTMHQT